MRHLIKNFIVVVVGYSIALSSPVSAKPSDLDGFVVVKNYVNKPGKKNFMGLMQKMERDLPSNVYEEQIKKLKGPNGKSWFQAAKLADNYSYFRYNNSKIFIRATVEKGKSVFYANGVRIDEADLNKKNLSLVELKLLRSYARGLSSGKSAWFNFFNISESIAGSIPETGKGTAIYVEPQQDECDSIRKEYEELKAENPQVAQQYADINQRCGLGGVIGGTPVNPRAKPSDKAQLWVILGILALVILLMSRKGKKDKDPEPEKETPETECGVGRGMDDSGTCVPRPNPPGHVNCGGDGAQCGGGNAGGGNADIGGPVPPPRVIPLPVKNIDVSDDPNFFGQNVDVDLDTPVQKTKSKTKK